MNYNNQGYQSMQPIMPQQQAYQSTMTSAYNSQSYSNLSNANEQYQQPLYQYQQPMYQFQQPMYQFQQPMYQYQYQQQSMNETQYNSNKTNVTTIPPIQMSQPQMGYYPQPQQPSVIYVQQPVLVPGYYKSRHTGFEGLMHQLKKDFKSLF